MLKCFSPALEFTQSNNNQHDGIHIYSHCISLELPTRALCFSLASTHNYSKDLFRKQKFKHLLISLARRHQKVNTGFTSIVCNWKKVQSHKSMEDNETVHLQIKFLRSGLFSWVILKVRIRRLSVLEQNMKLKTKQYLHIMLIQ